jgi:hypothetical protein
MTSTPLSVHAGDREVIDFTITGLSAAQLTGATAKLTLKWAVDNPAWVLQKTTGAGVTIDAANAKATVVIDPTDLTWMPRHRMCLFYDLEVTPSDSSGPVTADEGRLLVVPGLS